MIYKLENTIGEDGIIALLHKGNEKVLEIIFKHFQPGLFYFATQFLANSQSAEDIVADSFIKFWQKRHEFKSLGSIKAFLYIAVKNACLNQVKQNNRHAACHKELKYLSVHSEDVFTDQKIIKAELLHRIWEDIEKLPPVRRKIFKMIFLEGLNTLEIARALRISVDTVRVQKARALHTLRSILRQKL